MPHTMGEVLNVAAIDRHGPLFASTWSHHVTNALMLKNVGLEADPGSGRFRARIRRDAGLSVAIRACVDGEFVAQHLLCETLAALAIARRLWREANVRERFTVSLRVDDYVAHLVPRIWGANQAPSPHVQKLEAPFGFALEDSGSRLRDHPLEIAKRLMDRLFEVFGQRRCPYFVVSQPATLEKQVASSSEIAPILAALVET
jgi:hypothetical protein